MRLRTMCAVVMATAALVSWGCGEPEEAAQDQPQQEGAAATEMAAATQMTAAATDTTVAYVCPMHPDTTRSKPGVCPLDGCTGLLQMKDAPEGTVYVCPMHAEASEGAPGRCPTCDMFLHAKPPATP